MGRDPLTAEGGISALGIAGIDHALVGVRDLEAARAGWQRLGFTVTPRGRHIGWGTANCCIMLDSGYVELLGIVDPGELTNDLDRFLETREGLMGLAFASDDAGATREALLRCGIAADRPKELKRLLEMPEGEVQPAFRLVFLPKTATPDLSAFVCQHLTPDLIRRLGWTIHWNGAKRLVGLTIVSARPGEAAAGYAPLFGPEAVSGGPLESRVAAAAGELRFVAPGRLAELFPKLGTPPEHPLPWVAAMTIAVADLAETADLFDAAGIAWSRSRDGLAVPPSAANGVILEFVA